MIPNNPAPTQKTKVMNQNLVEVSNSRPVEQVPVVRQQINLRPPRFQIPCKSYTSTRPNQLQPIVETSSTAIQFENFPFFKILQQLSKPIQFETGSSNMTQILNVPDYIKHSVFESWNIDRQEYKIQIILILQQIEVNENVNKRLPYNITVSVNGHQCSLRQNNDPIDITQQINLTCLPHRLEITWSEEPLKYMGCVCMAQKLTWKDLLVELEKRPKCASDKTKVLIKKSMGNDDDMLVDSLVVSIKDPLSKLRMKLPARGVDCMHLECFDAIQFLKMNEQKQTWKCPLCRNKIKFENIVICEYFLKILQSKDLIEECDNVFFFKDGTWSVRKNREFSKISRINACRSTNNIEEFTLSDSDDEDSNRNLDNVDNDEIILKTKRFKNNGSSTVETNNRHQVKDKSKTVLCVITLD
ncbi:unnamed protein product [Macrosiphum euphorbiae]|uniref:SP-RING-type domain-containing protein n=1 Tax=Macrosiphum euphorbiae TaxID=13131 RepID=A0AAV0XYF4_9HEMI|nr:unnamed protein product [Macrosiphum euphorbiae]